MDPSNNRLTAPAGYTMSYDDAGNLKTDNYTGAGNREYDAENRMTKAVGGNGQWQEYTYDASGQRVRRKVNGTETWQVYGIGGELLAEYEQNASPSSPEKEYGYRNGQLLVTAEAGSAVVRTNVAAAANGGQAVGSTELTISGYSWAAGGAINGNRKGTNWGHGGGWADASSGDFSDDWLVITFDGNKTIDEVDLFTLQDNYGSPTEPNESMIFNTYGVSDFKVQSWNGSTWVDVPGATVTGNTNVWRKLTLQTPITTSKIKVVINDAIDHGYTRITEVEAWSPTTSGGTNINWLVADQLGTPRMIFDKTGSLANVERHDYLPFGEELTTQGLRNTMPGYSADNIRQKFTSYERDNETGLDYAVNRYYAPIQGMFTSADPLMASAKATDPQTWNRYNYCGNNPVGRVDPNGLDWWYDSDAPDATPEWKDRDPGGSWRRWTGTYSMIYYHRESKQWVALDPNGSRAYTGKSQQNAERAFEIFSGQSQGGITPAEADFLGGVSAGVSPLGILLNPVHEAAGLDTTSREYAWGIGAGALISFGFGFVSEGANSIRVGRWMSQGEYEAMAKSGLVQESSLNGVTKCYLAIEFGRLS